MITTPRPTRQVVPPPTCEVVRRHRRGKTRGGRDPTSSVDAVGRAGEHGAEVGAQKGHGDDDRERDQRDEQAVLDRGGAALGVHAALEADLQVLDEFVHGVSPTVSWLGSPGRVPHYKSRTCERCPVLAEYSFRPHKLTMSFYRFV